jgi:hypothetical protein
VIIKKIVQYKTIGSSLGCPLLVRLFGSLAEQMATREVQTSATAVARATLAYERCRWQTLPSRLLLEKSDLAKKHFYYHRTD